MICLQGGAEFGPDCREMDADLLDRAGTGPVVVLAAAAAPGREYVVAAANGVRHFRSLGATAVAAPDPASQQAAAVAAVAAAALLVLPGGSPTRLRAALLGTRLGDAVADVLAGGGAVMGASAGAMVLCEWTWLPGGSPTRLRAALLGTRLGDAVADVLAGGGAVMGASAGAMVLCEWTWLPDRRAVVPGLGHVPGVLVLPHYAGGPPPVPLPAGVDALGLPECAGVRIDADGWVAVGAQPTTVLYADGRLADCPPGEALPR